MIDQELLEAIPTGRTPQVAAFMIPGVNLSNVDVGGTNIINTTGGSLSIHGGSVADTRLLIDGITIANTEGTGWSANMLPNMGSTQEVAVDYSSVTAESITGGLQINMIPKTGGNRIRGLALRHRRELLVRGLQHQRRAVARGLRTPNSAEATSTTSTRGWAARSRADKLWFYTSARFTRQANYIGGLFQNRNAFDITKWTYEPDESKRAVLQRHRAERQPAPDLAGQPDQQAQFLLRPALALPVRGHRRPPSSQEAANQLEYPISDLCSVSYTADAVEPRPGRGALPASRREEYAYTPNNLRGSRTAADSRHRAGRPHSRACSIGAAGLQSATQPYQRTLGVSMPSSASLSYVTGSHSAKFGVYNVTAQRDVDGARQRRAS